MFSNLDEFKILLSDKAYKLLSDSFRYVSIKEKIFKFLSSLTFFHTFSSFNDPGKESFCNPCQKMKTC